MADKLMYRYNIWFTKLPFCRLQLVVETFGHSTPGTNQSKLKKDPKVIESAKKNTLLLKLWGLL